MRHKPISPDLFTHHRANLCALLPPNAIAILRSNDTYPTNADGTLPFIQNSDLYYLTGVAQEETSLILFPSATDPKDREILFIKETSEHIAIWEGEKLTKEQARTATGIQRIEWSTHFESTLHRLIPQADSIALNTNEHLRATIVVHTPNSRFIQDCQARYPLHHYTRLAPLMHRLRMIKSPEEIRIMQHACDITEAGFRRTLSFIKPGVGEWEIEAELLHEFIRRGSRGFAYAPIIGSGKNACILHYTTNNHRCAAGEMLLMDVAAEYSGWASDLTRTVPVSGKFTHRQRQVYDAVLRVFHAANSLLRPGNTPTLYQQQILELMERELVNLKLFTPQQARDQSPDKPLVKKYFMHGTSHHLGLDVHDVSAPHQPFAEGMVLTIEPGIYIREEALGIRLENDFLIGQHHNTDLMQSIPLEAQDIEHLMSS